MSILSRIMEKAITRFDDARIFVGAFVETVGFQYESRKMMYAANRIYPQWAVGDCPATLESESEDNVVDVPLLHSGFSVKVRPPTEEDIIAYDYGVNPPVLSTSIDHVGIYAMQNINQNYGMDMLDFQHDDQTDEPHIGIDGSSISISGDSDDMGAWSSDFYHTH